MPFHLVVDLDVSRSSGCCVLCVFLCWGLYVVVSSIQFIPPAWFFRLLTLTLTLTYPCQISSWPSSGRLSISTTASSWWSTRYVPYGLHRLGVAEVLKGSYYGGSLFFKPRMMGKESLSHLEMFWHTWRHEPNKFPRVRKGAETPAWCPRNSR